ncbi:MAG: alpha-N-arabinofuranosidase [Fimbriimonadaceae bacterium]|nr:alpha-N-arabinofuranosidase [Fimbriimonadaceae bacterium]
MDGRIPVQAQIKFEPSESAPVVNPNVYGHFAEHLGRCIYEGLWVGEDSPIPNVRGIRKDVVAALKALNLPVLRWPGGCFADEYHWKDGIGPRERRPAIFNTHWGGVVENNHFGTHEFFDLCEQLGCAAYVCGNVGSGEVREMQEWVEYITSSARSPMADLRRKNGREEPWKLPYFGVGNESWGCGGNMRPEYYADLYRRYATFVRDYTGNRVQRIACGANSNDTNWTNVLMERARGHMHGLSLHNYTLAGQKWPPSGSAIRFDEAAWIDLLKAALGMDGLIQRHAEVMDKHDPEKRVGMVVDEWGTWHAVEPGTNPGFLFQQNSLRDALVAAIHFHIFHRHADRVTMANIAQTVNVLQAMVLTDGPRMLRTPTYWVFEMFKVHQGGRVIPMKVQTLDYAHGGVSVPAVSASATRTDAIHVSLANLDPNSGVSVCIETGMPSLGVAEARVLTASEMTAHNTFDEPDAVRPAKLTTVRKSNDMIVADLPAKSVAILTLA